MATAYATDTTARPNAIAVPTTVDANAGSFDVQPKLTAVPQPISTSTIVPTASAKYFFIVILKMVNVAANVIIMSIKKVIYIYFNIIAAKIRAV